VDLVGPKSRGLALGLNEFAGYLAVGATAFATGYIAAATHALRPDPFYLGIGYAVLGLALSVFAIRDTSAYVRLEADKHPKVAPIRFSAVFTQTSFRDPTLFAACQAGLVNNLNDGMSWAIFPIFFAAHGLGIEHIGVLKAVYPAIWGVLQTVTGPLSDRWGRKGLIVWGMWVQAAGPDHYGRCESFRLVVGGNRAARDRHGDGLPDVARCHLGRLASNLAGAFPQHLSFLARFGLRRGRAPCWRHRGCFRVSVGNRGDWGLSLLFPDS
jgi:hypothetical protein